MPSTSFKRVNWDDFRSRKWWAAIIYSHQIFGIVCAPFRNERVLLFFFVVYFSPLAWNLIYVVRDSFINICFLYASFQKRTHLACLRLEWNRVCAFSFYLVISLHCKNYFATYWFGWRMLSSSCHTEKCRILCCHPLADHFFCPSIFIPLDGFAET